MEADGGGERRLAIGAYGSFSVLTIANLCPYWSWPPGAGGPARVYNLNMEVSREVNVLQFSARPTLGHQKTGLSNWIGSRHVRHSDSYRERQDFHPAILAACYLLYKAGLPPDLCLSSLLKFLPRAGLKRMISKASIVQVEHPWLFDLAEKLSREKPLIYIAHNVEADLWENPAIGNLSLFQQLSNKLREMEYRAVRRADVVVAMSTCDAGALVDRYGAACEKISVIPNGVDTNLRRPPTSVEKNAARERLKLGGRAVLLFIGSDHYPNKEALKHIQKWQAQPANERHLLFLIVGTAGLGLQSTPNMRVAGFVPDISDYLLAADIALNPVSQGSGTSLKVVEYLACGLPTVSTPVGIRGLNLRPGEDVLVGDLEDFPQTITRLLEELPLREKLSKNGRRVVEENYSWEKLGESMLEIYQRVAHEAMPHR
jgi:glycosyltransferase involved in cell wall biosynthesis